MVLAIPWFIIRSRKAAPKKLYLPCVWSRGKNCSPKTLRTYKQRLRYFSTLLQSAHGIVDVEALQLEHLHGWMAYLKKTPTYRGKSLSDESNIVMVNP
ncbi:MAG: hypothetical protein E6I91_18775 [Chloroflexi bacterium]|nr:MAG: hypothetical protein E6I91_18775 [Chloroflexota bacterium]